MSDGKRPRACDACHSIKIKCELGRIGGPGPCERCVRLGKECNVTTPKPQKTRVAELEAQVAELTKLLDAQKIPSPPESTTQTPQGLILTPQTNVGLSTDNASTQTGTTKKRRLDDAVSNDADVDPVYHLSTALDAIIAKDLQARILDHYVTNVLPVAPLVPLTDDEGDLETLRKTKPLLLQAIMFVAGSENLSADQQESVARLALSNLASKSTADGTNSIDLLQAIEVGVLGYRTPKNHRHIGAFQLIALAAEIAEDIGLAGLSSLKDARVGEDLNAVSATRVWLTCRILLASRSLFTRQHKAPPWSEHDDRGIFMLEYHDNTIPSDRLLAQFVRAERLCERIASKLDLSIMSEVRDITDEKLQKDMLQLQNELTDWKAQAPSIPRWPTLLFWEHVATLYLHETVLHTRTNRSSFAAPYLSERLSVTDFPMPLVTSFHITSIYTLKGAAHDLLDLCATMPVSTLLALPPLLFASRIAYAVYILVKLYIATTAPGNTLGAFLEPASLCVELYLEKLISMANSVKEVDDQCAMARVLASALRMKEWLISFKQSYIGSLDNTLVLDPSLVPGLLDTEINVTNDWLDFRFDDGALDLDLDKVLTGTLNN